MRARACVYMSAVAYTNACVYAVYLSVAEVLCERAAQNNVLDAMFVFCMVGAQVVYHLNSALYIFGACE